MKKLICLSASFIIIIVLHAQVTIENLLSAPFPSELKSSPDGKHIAWVFNNKGVRNIFIADAPSFAPRQITKHISDDGIDISDLNFSADNKYILFTEGNSTNGAGEAANPALLQEKTGQFVWMANIDGSGLRKIAAGDAALSSPDGITILFYSKGKAWQASSVDTSKAAAQLFEARGNMADLRYSPDGKKIAFISHRGDHAFLGIYNIALKTIEYPDPSVDIDVQPVWSPDGKWIAYIRNPNRKDVLPFTELREGSPWSIRLLDVEKNIAKELWKADEGRGSVLHMGFPVTDNFLLWADGNQLIFPWEKDGWQHLYAINIFSGGSPRLLTAGDGEIEYMTLSADKKSVVYNTNINDSHRRHIWKVNVSDGKAVQVSKGEGIEWYPVNTVSGIAVLRSTSSAPGWPSLLKENGTAEKIAVSFFLQSSLKNYWSLRKWFRSLQKTAC